MKAFVIVATKGRAKETYTLLDYLAKQTYPIEKIIVVGSEPIDVVGLESHPLTQSGNVLIELSTKAGSTIQRNVGLNKLTPFGASLNAEEWFVAFFDDDFRPAVNWLESSSYVFSQQSDWVGLGGWVLADGINGLYISEENALNYLNGVIPPAQHAWFGEQLEVEGLYGCNMAYRGNVASTLRFDENLPLYGWQEDVDYGGMAIKFGKLFYTNQCVGVHLGVKGGRTSGIRFGYSQIANPIYLAKKGTMNKSYAKTILLNNVVSNIFHTITFDQTKDYKGRLYGNFLAVCHLLTAQLHPTKILEI